MPGYIAFRALCVASLCLRPPRNFPGSYQPGDARIVQLHAASAAEPRGGGQSAWGVEAGGGGQSAWG
eukprot:gene1026-1127_t